MADEVETIAKQNSTPRGRDESGLLRALWVFFSEMKTAIVLLLVLAFVSIVGTVIKQSPIPSADDYIRLYGPRTWAIISYLNLNDIYDSILYRILLSLVGINLTVCSVNRFGITWRRAFEPKTEVDEKTITQMQRSETLNCSGTVEDIAGKVAEAVRSRAYRVTRSSGSGHVAMFASKGAPSLWGPYLTHLSLLVIFIGAIFGDMTGFDGFTAIDEGGATTTYAYDVKGQPKMANLGFRMALRNFKVAYDAQHNPTAYSSDVAVYEGDKLMAERVIDVNRPLTYKGISFFQSSYGVGGIRVKVTAPNGETAHVVLGIGDHSGSEDAGSMAGGGQVSIGGKTVTLFAGDVMPSHGGVTEGMAGAMPSGAARIMINDQPGKHGSMSAWNDLGWIGVGRSVPYKGFDLALEGFVEYSELQVSRNPGLPVIYFGFGLLLTGVFLSFYVPYRVMRLRITASERGVKVIVGASSKDDAVVFDRDFDRIRGGVS